VDDRFCESLGAIFHVSETLFSVQKAPAARSVRRGLKVKRLF